MGKYCSKCGTLLDPESGLCPVCDKKELKKYRKSKKRSHSRIGRWIAKTILILLSAGLLVSAGVLFAVFRGYLDIPYLEEQLKAAGFLNREEAPLDEYEVEFPDAEEYYSTNAELEKVVDVEHYEGLLSEKDADAFLKDRGFTMAAVTVQFDIEGNYFEEREISENGSDYHPMYHTYYQSSEGEIWSVTVVGNQIVASPMMYNINEAEVPVIVSEDTAVTGYDSVTNSFYISEPHTNVRHVLTVQKIDSATLDSLNLEED